MLTIPSFASIRQFTVYLPTGADAYMRIYLPEQKSKPCRALLAVPGGGYRQTSIENNCQWAIFFAERHNMAFAVLHYRMPDGNPRIPVSDVTAALRLLHDSAQTWNINPADIGIMGTSAGGHLASLTACTAEQDLRQSFQILFYPVITMGEKGAHKGSRMRFLGKDCGNAEVEKRYSTELLVNDNTPPAFITASADDYGVPPEANTMAYCKALIQKNISASMHIYPSGGHGWTFSSPLPFHDALLAELDSWLSSLPERCYNSRLYGRKIAFFGDSYVRNHKRPYQEAWHAIFAHKYGMEYFNFGRNGSRVSMDSKRFGPAMYKRCRELPDSLDFIVIIAGHNDTDLLDSISTDSFKKAVTLVIRQLKKKSPDAVIAWFSPWRTKNYQGSNRQRVIQIIEKVCRRERIAFFNCAENSGILANEEMFRKKYFQSTSDGAHLNAQGHKLFLPKAEVFLLNAFNAKQ